MNEIKQLTVYGDDYKVCGVARVGLIKVAALLLISLAALLLLTSMATAIGTNVSTSNKSTVIVTYESHPVIWPPPRIEQGGIVYLNDTVDITGVSGWPDGIGEYHIAWYGQWMTEKSPMDVDPVYIITLPGKTRSGSSPSQYEYYIDPDIFLSRPGYWYQMPSNSSRERLRGESAGNLQAFKVIPSYRIILNSTSNETETIYQSGGYTEEKKLTPPLMPEIHKTDYLVALGDSFSLDASGCNLWVFGNKDGLYGIPCGNISSETMDELGVGNYNLYLQYPGKNTIYESSYINGVLEPGLYGKKPVDVRGYDPVTIKDKFIEMVKESDDILEKYSLVVEDPYITMDRLDEVYVLGNPVYDIRGYSNTVAGTDVTITIDEDQTYYTQIPHHTVTTKTERTSAGNLSYYRAYLPIDYDQLSALSELHTLIARIPSGKEVLHTIKISTMPADSFKPNATIKFTEDVNPFITTPTPEVIVKVEEKIVPGPTQIVTVTITPSPEEIQNEWKSIATVWFVTAAMALVVIVAVIVFLKWMLSIYRRVKIS